MKTRVTLLASVLLLLPTLVSSAVKTNKFPVYDCDRQIRIAVVDTGLDLKDPRFEKNLCPTGHKDFTGEGIADTYGHGTHVTGLIQKYAAHANYCLLIYKYYDSSVSGRVNMIHERDAFQEAISNNADVINFSGGGTLDNDIEYLIIKNHPETLFVVAAGNEGSNLDRPGNEYYPASYWLSNEIVVANYYASGEKVPSSNYGNQVLGKEDGFEVFSTLPNGKTGYMTGTSQSTAIFSGKLVDRLSKMCKY